jgi:DNA polymerase-3 subunit alpha
MLTSPAVRETEAAYVRPAEDELPFGEPSAPVAPQPPEPAPPAADAAPIAQPARKERPPLPVAPAPAERPAPDRPARIATIYLRSLGDKHRDILHMRRVHGAIISYPGGDHFVFQVFEGRSSYLLEFPNDTTDLSDELIARLEDMLGPNNVRIEDLQIH